MTGLPILLSSADQTSTGLSLTLVAKTATKITFSWTPPKCDGYVFYRDGVPVTVTWDPTWSQVSLGISDTNTHTYAVQAITLGISGHYVA